MGKETAVLIEARKIATIFNIRTGKIDDVNKEEFSKVYDLIKFEDGREEAVKALGEASKAIAMDSRRRAFNSTLQMAIVYCTMNKAVTFSMVSWDNLKAVVRLYKYVHKHYDDNTCKKLIKDLDVYQKGIGVDRYNNNLETKIKFLKELHKVAEVATPVEYEKVVVEVDKMTTADKQQLLEYLIGQIETSVAA